MGNILKHCSSCISTLLDRRNIPWLAVCGCGWQGFHICQFKLTEWARSYSSFSHLLVLFIFWLNLGCPTSISPGYKNHSYSYLPKCSRHQTAATSLPFSKRIETTEHPVRSAPSLSLSISLPLSLSVCCSVKK